MGVARLRLVDSEHDVHGRLPGEQRLYGRDDFQLAAATADVSGEEVPDAILVGVRNLLQQRLHRQDQSRRAVGALESSMIDERLLDGVQGAAPEI